MKQISTFKLWLITLAVTLLLDVLGILILFLNFPGNTLYDIFSDISVLCPIASFFFGIFIPIQLGKTVKQKLICIFLMPTNLILLAGILFLIFSFLSLCAGIISMDATPLPDWLEWFNWRG